MKAPQSAITREILADDKKAAQLIEAARTGSPGPIEINGKVVYLKRVGRRVHVPTNGNNRRNDKGGTRR